MRTIINVILILIILVLIYLLYAGISEPIKFKREKEKREDAVIQRLMDIRTAQEHYRGITGAEFADSFQKLKDTLTYGTFMNFKLDEQENPDDPNNPIVLRDTTFVPAKDSIPKLGLNLDSLALVPYGKGAKFEIDADTITYQKTLVNVVEVKTQKKVFMGKFADNKYKRYDDFYEPEDYLKFGDMGKPNTAGNWER
jgi:hypothetical protein